MPATMQCRTQAVARSMWQFMSCPTVGEVVLDASLLVTTGFTASVGTLCVSVTVRLSSVSRVLRSMMLTKIIHKKNVKNAMPETSSDYSMN